MGGEWVEVRIKDIVTVVGGSTPSTKDALNFGGDIPWLTPKDLSGTHPRYVSRGNRNLSLKGLHRCSATLLPKNTVLLTTRAPIGYVALSANPIATNQGFRSLIVKPEFDHEFLYYWLKVNKTKLERHASGSTFKELSGTALKNIAIRLPTSKAEQRAIAHILGSLDDKIELNRQMAQTLESIARAIFKSWFVDFDPVKAKMEGKQPEGMSEEIAALFPDRLVDSELGMIPEGWEHKALGDMINIFDSKRIPLSRSQRKARQGKYPYYGATSIMDYVDDYIFDGVYVLIGEDGSVKKPEGTPFLQYVSGKIWVNNHAHVIQGKRLVTSEYIYLFLSGFNIGPFITGAVQPKLNQKNLKLIPIISPNDKIMELFNETISIVFEKIICLQKECKTLQGLRDTLLPQLISGKIRVNQPEDAAA